MTIEQDKAYAEACARGAAMQLEKQHKGGKRAGKRQRKIIAQTQGNICPLCGEKLGEQTRFDKTTGKLLHAGCQLALAALRPLIDNGITLDRIAQFIQVPTPAASAPTTALVDSFDPFTQ